MNTEKLMNDQFNKVLQDLFIATSNQDNSILTTASVPLKKPFIIEIEGTDRSGKETQSNAIKGKLEEMGFKVAVIHFPRYESNSTDSVKKYLAGEYGNISDVNECQASLFYAQDRLDFTLTEYQTYAELYDILIFDRYVGSNLIHQSIKANDWNKFTDYQYQYEYFNLKLPRPNITFLLDMPIDLGKKIAKNRCNKIDGKKKQDIHESNDEYMNKCYEMAHNIASKYRWVTIKCYSEFGPFRKIKKINTITDEIMEILDYPINTFKQLQESECVE